MRFLVERDALADALAWVARALPSRPVVPVLSGLRLEAGDGLTLSCFDYEVSATAHLDAEVKEPGTVLVPGRLLAEITRSLPAPTADFAADGDVVNLTCGSAEFTFVQLPSDEYPALPQAPPLAGTIDGGDLAAAIGQVLPAASRDDTLPMLTGICLDIDGETMTLAATDRYRLAVRETGWHPVSPGLRAVALVPARTLADAARTMAPGSAVSVAFETGPGARGAGRQEPGGQAGEGGGGADREPRPAEGMISFGMGGRRLTARLIGGEFIRYRSRFPSEFGCRADVPAGPFTEAVKRVSLVADRASPVRLEFGSGKVIVEARPKAGHGPWRPSPLSSTAISRSSRSTRTTCSMAWLPRRHRAIRARSRRPVTGPSPMAARGPTARGPTARGPTARGPTAREPAARGPAARGLVALDHPVRGWSGWSSPVRPSQPSSPGRKTAPRKTAPRKTAPRKTAPRKTAPRKGARAGMSPASQVSRSSATWWSRCGPRSGRDLPGMRGGTGRSPARPHGPSTPRGQPRSRGQATACRREPAEPRARLRAARRGVPARSGWPRRRR